MKKSLSFLGIIAPDRDPIEYHERPPLVVPKTMELPKPAAQRAAARNAAWPVDPDVAAKLKEKAEESQPVRNSGSEGSADPNNARLPIWNILAGRSSSQPIQTPGYGRNDDKSYLIPNGVLRAQGQQFAAQDPSGDKEDQIRPGHEPKRRYLTDPPSGYRLPSANASFKKQYGAPVRAENDKTQAWDFVREQVKRQEGSYDPDKDQ